VGLLSYFVPTPPHSPTNEGAQSTRIRQFPETHEEWRDWQCRLHDAYLGVPYSLGEIQGWHLFRALDTSGNILAETRRLTRDIAFVVDTDTTALAGASWSLEPQDGTEGGDNAAVEAGLEVWRRSRVQQQKARWAKTAATMGSVVIEAVGMSPERGNRQTTLVAYDPRWCRLEYDVETGTELQRVVVEFEYFDEGEVRDGRFVENPVQHTYTREITRSEVTVWVDGEVQDGESGPHGQTVVTAVHLPFLLLPSDPCHGLWAAPGLEHSLSNVDSLLTQVAAIGNRHANPLLTVWGAKLEGGGGDVFQHGRIINGLPVGGDARYIEASLTGVSALLQAAEQAREQAKATLPEFLFTEAGANSSGSALNFRAAQFVAKMEEVRGRWFDAVAQITEVAIAMDTGTAWDPDDRLLRVSAPPVLPVNMTEELANLVSLMGEKLLTKRDAVTRLQRLGWVPDDRDVDEYLAELQTDRQGEVDASETGALLRALGDGITAEPLEGGPDEIALEGPAPPDET